MRKKRGWSKGGSIFALLDPYGNQVEELELNELIQS